jgi:tetratricopeptide (TPR) repeat protein
MAADPDMPGFGDEILAPALAAQGKTKEAMQMYSFLMSQNDINGRVELPYALLLLKDGKYDDALSVYRRVLPVIGSNLDIGSTSLIADSDFLPDEKDVKKLEADIRIALGFTYDGATTWGGHSQQAKALAEFAAAYALEKDSPLADIAYANGLREVGRNLEARAILQSVASASKGEIKESATDLLARTPPMDVKKPIDAQ